MSQLQIVESGRRSDSQEFQRKVGIKYCVCGKECLDTDNICECGEKKFMFNENPEVSEIVGGYVDLAKNGNLKNFYFKYRNKGTIIKMNEKRIITQLLLHKNKINISKELIDKIYNANT